MVMWAMLAALESEVFDEIYLSSEDPEILDMAFAGITPLIRENRLSGDLVPQWEPVVNVVQTRSTWPWTSPADSVCMVTAVCPLTTAELIQETAKVFESTEKRQLTTVIPARHGWNVSEGIDGDPANGVVGLLDHGNKQSTELPVLYIPSGNLRWWRYEDVLDGSGPVLATGAYGTDTYGYVVSEEIAVDVDMPFDFRIAELLLNQRRASRALAYTGAEPD